jgi:hypothetical protein
MPTDAAARKKKELKTPRAHLVDECSGIEYGELPVNS